MGEPSPSSPKDLSQILPPFNTASEPPQLGVQIPQDCPATILVTGLGPDNPVAVDLSDLCCSCVCG